MKRIHLLIGAGVLAVLIGLGYWLWPKLFKEVSDEVALPQTGEARFNPLYALKLALAAHGEAVSSWPNLSAAMRHLGPRDTLSLAFFGATQLALVVAVVTIGTGRHAISSTVGAALIGAGMITVLAFPIVGTRLAASRETIEAEHLRPAREF